MKKVNKVILLCLKSIVKRIKDKSQGNVVKSIYFVQLTVLQNVFEEILFI